MRKLAMIGAIVVSGIIFTGCATKGFVLDEIEKSKTELNNNIKEVQAYTAKVQTEASQRMANIETSYALKAVVESDAYNREQKLMQAITKQIDDLKVSLKKLEDLKEAAVDKLSQNLQKSVYIFMKQLKGQKEGIEQAMEELDKIISESTSAPASQPAPAPAPQPAPAPTPPEENK